MIKVDRTDPALEESSTNPLDRGRLSAGRWIRGIPWFIAASLFAIAVVLPFSTLKEEVDTDFPDVQRGVFSAYSPMVYRLAEPGDTLDRVGVYLASLGLVVTSLGGWRSRDRLWLSGWCAVLLTAWVAACPWPTFDGWHGLNPRALFEPTTPIYLKLVQVALLLGISVMMIGPLWSARGRIAKSDRSLSLLFVTASACGVYRIVAWPDPDPTGYWPRWALILGLTLFLGGLIRVFPFQRRREALWLSLGLKSLQFSAVAGLILLGLWSIWLHRPLNRLKVIEPGRVYISAMPTYGGLEVAQARHQFKTIINLFNENGRQRHPNSPDEKRFVAERGLRYIERPDADTDSEIGELEFIKATLAVARDPKAWPVLVHCHGCMDRTPAWAGLYRFLDQGWSLTEVMTEIERHRGLRPKGSVYLLYNWALPQLAAQRFNADPTSKLLKAATAWSVDPYQASRSEPRESSDETIGVHRQTRRSSSARLLGSSPPSDGIK